eukprot:TRINITY_DN8040_c0_g1_i1.p1 TRINITY_DN8040_c0_g1~~TRINITY_DN8040_c0_g1_i1.p1  ORF type:complete len:1281 (+),score=437.24 TRINITY_DN8040_c0_g1_i1:53-3895(+)
MSASDLSDAEAERLKEIFGDDTMSQIPAAFRDDPSLPDEERSLRKQLSLMYLRGMTRGGSMDMDDDKESSTDGSGSPASFDFGSVTNTAQMPGIDPPPMQAIQPVLRRSSQSGRQFANPGGARRSSVQLMPPDDGGQRAAGSARLSGPRSSGGKRGLSWFGTEAAGPVPRRTSDVGARRTTPPPGPKEGGDAGPEPAAAAEEPEGHRRKLPEASAQPPSRQVPSQPAHTPQPADVHPDGRHGEVGVGRLEVSPQLTGPILSAGPRTPTSQRSSGVAERLPSAAAAEASPRQGSSAESQQQHAAGSLPPLMSPAHRQSASASPRSSGPREAERRDSVLGRRTSAAGISRTGSGTSVLTTAQPLSLKDAKAKYGQRWHLMSQDAKRAVLQGGRVPRAPEVPADPHRVAVEHDVLIIHRDSSAAPLGLVFDPSGALLLAGVERSTAAARTHNVHAFIGRPLESVNGTLVASVEEVEKLAGSGDVALRFGRSALAAARAPMQRSSSLQQLKDGQESAALSSVARRALVKSTMMWRERVGGGTDLLKSAQAKAAALERIEVECRDKQKALRHRVVAAIGRLQQTEDTDWASLDTAAVVALRQERATLRAFVASAEDEEQRLVDQTEAERQRYHMTEDERTAFRVQQRKDTHSLSIQEESERRRRALDSRQEERQQRVFLQAAVQRSLEASARERLRLRQEWLREHDLEEEKLRSRIVQLEREAAWWVRQAQQGVPGAEQRLAEIRQAELPLAREALELHRASLAAAPQLTHAEERALRGAEAMEARRKQRQQQHDKSRERYERILVAKRRYATTAAANDTPAMRALLRAKIALRKQFDQHWAHSVKMQERMRVVYEHTSALIAELVHRLRDPFTRLEVLGIGHRTKENAQSMEEEINRFERRRAEDLELTELDANDRTLLRTLRAEEAERGRQAEDIDLMINAVTDQLNASSSIVLPKKRSKAMLEQHVKWWERPTEEPPESMASRTYVELLRSHVADAYEQAEEARQMGQELVFHGTHPLSTLPPKESAKGLSFYDACWYTWEESAGDTFKHAAVLRRIESMSAAVQRAEEAALAAVCVAVAAATPADEPDDTPEQPTSPLRSCDTNRSESAAERVVSEHMETLRSDSEQGRSLALLRQTMLEETTRAALEETVERPRAPADFFGIKEQGDAVLAVGLRPGPTPRQAAPLSRRPHQRRWAPASDADRPMTAAAAQRRPRVRTRSPPRRRRLYSLAAQNAGGDKGTDAERAAWLGVLRTTQSSLAREQRGVLRAVADARRLRRLP